MQIDPTQGSSKWNNWAECDLGMLLHTLTCGILLVSFAAGKGKRPCTAIWHGSRAGLSRWTGGKWSEILCGSIPSDDESNVGSEETLEAHAEGARRILYQ